MSVAARSTVKDSESVENLSSRLPYQGFHAYPWNLQRHAPGHGGAGSAYPYNYYNTNPYYRNWFHNYKEQWHQHWQRFRGAAQYNEKFSSILGKLPRSKLYFSIDTVGVSFNCTSRRLGHQTRNHSEHSLKDAPTAHHTFRHRSDREKRTYFLTPIVRI